MLEILIRLAGSWPGNNHSRGWQAVRYSLPDISQPAIDMKWVQVVFECRGHDVEV